ncbi:hypothetical protein FC41_GL000712 [Lactobacillus hominis DSM 23910 = CRBIP 24.179]|uniref:G-protein coupled receptors family 1 profile domain-containing protein n=1 Tax=Lactobacillus hominis DSM 23910 = CRBIP 24.179 TaxID=1423758 RepID=I7LAE9_9LACO|nr:hypothetical protein FC41_GL000712 [Lactobacillus hominis DSM 23910 = CRBIP 24.179]MCT3348170.1 hypothetical protein [Lactobacillus hominis]CCI82194.1 Putative uncharacterized protein [Lactobacillus hominis DSM 23910 = CRBIP 24.179]
MRIFEGIGLIIYLFLTAIVIRHQIQAKKSFRTNKINAETFQKLTKRNLILLTLIVIFLLLFLYTPFKLIFI